MVTTIDRTTFVWMAAVAFVVVVAGICAGMFLAARLGIVKSADASQLMDATQARKIPDALVEGRPVPDLALSTADQQPVSLRDLADQPSIIAFVSPACGPCENLLFKLNSAPTVSSGAYRVITVSKASEGIPGGFSFISCTAADSAVTNLGVHVFPTIVVAHQGVISYAKVTFLSTDQLPFFDQML